MKRITAIMIIGCLAAMASAQTCSNSWEFIGLELDAKPAPEAAPGGAPRPATGIPGEGLAHKALNGVVALVALPFEVIKTLKEGRLQILCVRKSASGPCAASCAKPAANPGGGE